MSDTQEFKEEHVIEALDRIDTIMVLVENRLEDHPAIIKAGIGFDIDVISNSLFNCFQAVKKLERRDND